MSNYSYSSIKLFIYIRRINFMKKIKFNNSDRKDFMLDLRHSVDNYFTQNKISRFGNINMYLKTVFMLSLYCVPYFLMILGYVDPKESSFLFWLLWFLMGFGMAGIGMSVMHDANHGGYSKNRFVNKILGLTLNFLGGSAKNWRIQHNKLHHTFTNIHDMDPDVGPVPILRFSPDTPMLKVHKFQHIYAWFFYGLMSLSWATIKEFRQTADFKKRGLINSKEYVSLMAEMIIWKIIYYLYLLVLPMILIPNLSFGFWFLGFFTMHFVAGFILGAIFQTAHIMPDCAYPQPDDTGNIETNWIIHQLQTTSNYAPNSKLFSWFVGGLNFQVEHHLFPTICHVHYKNISKIVKAKAEEYKLPYYSQKNFRTSDYRVVIELIS